MSKQRAFFNILIVKVVGILKSISASQVFREYPELKKYLRKQAFGKDGCFFRYHRHEEHEAKQLKLFKCF